VEQLALADLERLGQSPDHGGGQSGPDVLDRVGSVVRNAQDGERGDPGRFGDFSLGLDVGCKESFGRDHGSMSSRSLMIRWTKAYDQMIDWQLEAPAWHDPLGTLRIGPPGRGLPATAAACEVDRRSSAKPRCPE
jgi:hypothetical protein